MEKVLRLDYSLRIHNNFKKIKLNIKLGLALYYLGKYEESILLFSYAIELNESFVEGIYLFFFKELKLKLYL